MDFDLNNINALPGNQILVKNTILRLYDQNLQLVKKIESLNGLSFASLGFELNLEEKKFYIPDVQHHRIIMTDFEFNFIKVFGSLGNSNDQLKYPFDLCLANNNLYVLDSGNNRIQIFLTNLEFVKSWELDYWLYQIKALNMTLFVQSNEEIYLYNLNDLSLIQKYGNGFCQISKMNSNIYGFNFQAQKLFCYDDKANCEEITYANKYLQSKTDGSLVELNGAIYMSSRSNRKILRFTKN